MIKDYKLEIKKIPEIPRGLIEAYENNSLVIFVGAGISRLMGCKGWDSMAYDLIEKLYPPAEANLINGDNKIDQITKITIAKQHARETKKMDVFWEVFKEAITPEKGKEDVYNIISQLRTRFITTNCDGLLVKKYKNNYTLKYDKENFNEKIGQSYVFCIHGNYKDGKNSLVFTIDEYLENYKPGKPLVDFLVNALSNNTVLFLGYGLNEFQILSTAFKGSNKRHYLLDGYYEYQKDLAKAKKLYYDKAGIELIPFSLDVKSYDQQIDIIKDWIDCLKQQTSYLFNPVSDVQELVNEYNKQSKEELYRLINSKSLVRDECLTAFWSCVQTSKNAREWLEFVIDRRIVLTNDLLKGSKAKNNNNYVNCPFLSCLKICIRNKLVSLDDSLKIKSFVRKYIEKENDKKSLFDNYQLLTDLGEILLSKKECPDVLENKVIDKYIRSTYDSGYYCIKLNIINIITWPKNVVLSIIGKCISRNDADSFINIFDFWLLFNSVLNADIKYEVMYLYIDKLMEEEKDKNFFQTINERFEKRRYGYSQELFKAIDSFINHSNYRELINHICIGDIGVINNQLVLYILKKCKVPNINILSYNPLNIRDSFVDFYYWLYEQKDNIGIEELNQITSMVEEANFGYDLKSKDGVNNFGKRVNTYKRHLYELINNDKSNQLKVSITNYYENSKNPVDNKDDYLVSRVYEKQEHFSDDFFSFNGKELLKELEKEIDECGKKHHEFETFDIVADLFRKITNKQKEALLFESLKSTVFLNIFCCLSADMIQGIDNEVFKNYLYSIQKLIINEKYSEIRTDVVANYARFIRDLNKLNWNHEEIVKISLDGLKNGIVDKYEEIIHDDLISFILNDPKSVVFSRLIISVQFLKDDCCLKEEFKKYTENNICNKSIKYTLAHYINAAVYIDKEWTKKTILSYFEKVSDSNIDLLITFNSKTIYPEVANYVVKSMYKTKIVQMIGKQKKLSYLEECYISYFVCGFAFDQIEKSDYLSFLCNINEIGYSQITSSIIKNKNINKCKKIEIIDLSLDYLTDLNRNITMFANKVVSSISSEDSFNNQLWSHICKYVELSIEEDNWVNLERILQRTAKNNRYILTVIELLKKSKVTPYDYILKEYIKNLKRLGNKKAVLSICRYAINKKIDPIYYSKLANETIEMVVESVN